MREVAEREGMDQEQMRAARRTRGVVRVTKLFCQLAVRKFGHTGSKRWTIFSIGNEG